MSLERQAGIVLYQGEDANFNDFLKNPDGSPLDLTSATEISARIANTDSTYLELLKSTDGVSVVGAPGGGEVNLVVTAAQALLLMVQNPSPIEYRVTIASKVTIIQRPWYLAVAPALFPTPA